MKALGVTKLDDESKSSNEISIKILCKRGTDETTLKQIETLLYKKSKHKLRTANTVMTMENQCKLVFMTTYINSLISVVIHYVV